MDQTMRTAVYSPGMRVKVRRGVFPMDDALVGATGLIVAVDGYTPIRYGVTLDGENEMREFAEDELEPYAGAARRPEELGATGPTVGPSPSGGSGGQH
jgi:hypothetical protein